MIPPDRLEKLRQIRQVIAQIYQISLQLLSIIPQHVKEDITIEELNTVLGTLVNMRKYLGSLLPKQEKPKTATGVV